MLSSINFKKNNQSVRNKNPANTNNIKKIQLSIEDAIKYYQVYYVYPNSIFLFQLKGKILKKIINILTISIYRHPTWK